MNWVRPIADDGGDDIPMAALAQSELKRDMAEAMESLSDRERTVLQKRFGLGQYADAGAQTLDDTNQLKGADMRFVDVENFW